ncbi:MAG: N-acetylmuramoyl-L-alanine amidase [Myxococcaceae bacterium]
MRRSGRFGRLVEILLPKAKGDPIPYMGRVGVSFVVAVMLLHSEALAGERHSPQVNPEAAYQEAAKSYYALKRDAGRRRFRHSWLNVAEKFESVAKRHPKSNQAPRALFTAAQLYEDLSRISLMPADLSKAAGAYQKLTTTHAKHRLADDAALALAKLELERRSHHDKALEVAQNALKCLPRGDRARELRDLVSNLKAHAPAPARVARRKTPEAKAKPNDSAEVAAADVRDAEEAEDAEIGEARKVADVPEAPSRRLAYVAPHDAGEPTLAEQLGLKVRRVVIDPGHGGHDSGALGRRGTREKDVALDIAKKVAETLEGQGLEVVLTRDDDRFVSLEGRAQVANEARGDLFVSIHCNAAASRKLRGVETYTLNLSSDRYAIRLAARENSSSEKGMSDLQFILADLATKANTDESERLAHQVQSHIVSGLRASYEGVKDLGTKEALFYVLLGVKMPAILVETSFLSHAEEENRLASARYRSDMARAVAKGIEAFLGRRDRLAQVDALP